MRQNNPALVEESESKATALKQVFRQDLRFFINSLRSSEKRKEQQLKEEEPQQKKIEKKKKN